MVLIDELKCIGCGICSLACPFGAISYDDKSKIAFKCDLCSGDPMCAKVCGPKTIKYNEADSQEKSKREQLAQKLLHALVQNDKVV